MAFLEVEGLTLDYATPRGPLRAVDSVSFSIERAGTALGLIGETGSGKSSLVMALARILPRNVERYTGRVLFDGKEIMGLSNDAYRRTIRWKQVSVVFQGSMNGFNPVLKVGRQLTERMMLEPGADKNGARKKALGLLKDVGLPPEIFNSYPHELSGGMKQRAAIAMALGLDPRLMILDEPTSALDVSVQAQIMNLLKRLKGELGISMIFITHDIALASEISDDLGVMYAGQLRELGSAEDIMLRPADPYTQELLASIPRLHGGVAPKFVSGTAPDPMDRPAGCRFRLRCPKAFDRCVEEPPLQAAGDGHLARCRLVGGGAGDATAGNRAADATARGATGSPAGGDRLPRDGGSGGRPVTAHVATEDLRVYFHSRRGLFKSVTVKAVDGVSIHIPRGKTLALVGESGSGKTSLGRAILKLAPLESGRVYFEGTDLGELKPRDMKLFRRKAQAIFQDPYSSISPYMTVSEIIEEPLVIHGMGGRSERRKAVVAAIEMAKLTPAVDFADKYPHNLSGGQRQRVSIARAMILKPSFVVADEPVSMVDASNRAEVLTLLRELQRERNVSFLYITHDIANARHFSDSIAVMYLGTIVEEGVSTQVIDSPLHPYTKGLIAAVPEPDPANRSRFRPVMQGELPSASRVPSGCPFHPRCERAIQGTCETVRPETKDMGDGHLVACHLYKDQKP